MQAKFGLSLSNRAVLFGWTTLDDLLDVAQMAERLGYFHSVWVGDNLLSKPRAEAIVTLMGTIRPPWNPAYWNPAYMW